MVKKLPKVDMSKLTPAQLSESVKDSAQQIWQAGLGAFNRAQAEGSKAYESLVKEGVSIQRKTQNAADEQDIGGDQQDVDHCHRHQLQGFGPVGQLETSLKSGLRRRRTNWECPLPKTSMH